MFEDCAFNKDIRKNEEMIAPGTSFDATVVSIQFQDNTFDLRLHADMHRSSTK